MTECHRIRADAPGLAALPSGDSERVAAWSHARTCPGCERALRDAERLLELVGAWEPPPLAAGALDRASRAIVTELRAEARRRALGAVAAAGVAAILLVALARGRSSSPADWTLAAVLGVLAVSLAAAASRNPVVVTAIAVVAAVAAATAPGGSGPLATGLGLHCLASELLAATAVVGATWLAIRGGTTTPARSALAAAAGTGALAGDAALQITCGAQASVPHQLAFHVGGVVVAVAAAALLWRRRAPAAAALGG